MSSDENIRFSWCIEVKDILVTAAFILYKNLAIYRTLNRYKCKVCKQGIRTIDYKLKGPRCVAVFNKDTNNTIIKYKTIKDFKNNYQIRYCQNCNTQHILYLHESDALDLVTILKIKKDVLYKIIETSKDFNAMFNKTIINKKYYFIYQSNLDMIKTHLEKYISTNMEKISIYINYLKKQNIIKSITLYYKQNDQLIDLPIEDKKLNAFIMKDETSGTERSKDIILELTDINNIFPISFSNYEEYIS